MNTTDGVGAEEKRALLDPEPESECRRRARKILEVVVCILDSIGMFFAVIMALELMPLYGYETPSFRGVSRVWLDPWGFILWFWALVLSLLILNDQKNGEKYEPAKLNPDDISTHPLYDSYWEFFSFEPLWALFVVFMVATAVVGVQYTFALGFVLYPGLLAAIYILRFLWWAGEWVDDFVWFIRLKF